MTTFHKTRKRVLTGFSAVLLSLLSVASFAQDEAPYQVKQFSNSVKRVESVTTGGNIRVAGGNESKVEMYVRGNNGNRQLSRQEIEERLATYDVTLEEQGDKIVAKAKRKAGQRDNWKNGVSISFVIYTPVKIDTDLRTSGGNIDLENLEGKLNFTTSGGNLHLKALRGRLDGQTSGGNIEMQDCHDEVEVATSGGNIYAKRSDGKLSLTTSGGNLMLKDLDGEIRASTSGGNIDARSIKGELRTSTSGGNVVLEDIFASLEASTSGGGITASITSLGKYLRLNTSAGDIRVNMPLTGGLDLDVDGDRVSVGALNNFSGKIEKDRVVGKLNGGGIPVEISASSGSVALNGK